MNLYQKLNVPELMLIQEEILKYIDKNVNITEKEMEDAKNFAYGSFCRSVPTIDEFPTLKNWLMPRLKMPLQYLNLMFIPPETKFQIHQDGAGDITQKVIINVPIKNYNEATTHWFNHDDVTEDDTFTIYCANNKPPLFGYHISFVKNDVELTPIASVTADNITLMRGDVYHGVTNNSDKIRIVLIIRAGPDEGKINFDFDDLLDFQDLL
jgi:hypothetical protein